MPDFDDEWYEDWKRRLGESGGNIILALGLRPIEESAERVVMEMPYGPNVHQGTGVFAFTNTQYLNTTTNSYKK